MLVFLRLLVVTTISAGWLVTTINAGKPQEIPPSVIVSVVLLFGEKGVDLFKRLRK